MKCKATAGCENVAEPGSESCYGCGSQGVVAERRLARKVAKMDTEVPEYELEEAASAASTQAILLRELLEDDLPEGKAQVVRARIAELDAETARLNGLLGQEG
jgi:hypothetical protein